MLKLLFFSYYYDHHFLQNIREMLLLQLRVSYEIIRCSRKAICKYFSLFCRYVKRNLYIEVVTTINSKIESMFSVVCCSPWSPSNTAHSTQHTAHSTQHTAHSTQHTAHSTQHTTHSTQHTTQSTQHTAHDTQQTTHSTQHTAQVDALQRVKGFARALLLTNRRLR